MDSITITRPDDWHLHLRDGDVLQNIVPQTCERFARAIIMPNLVPPVTNTQQAQAYLERIKQSIPSGNSFQPLMTLYLTDNSSAELINQAAESGIVKAVKLYPAGATTNSDAGVTDIKHCYPALEAMQKHQMPLLVHGEVTQANIDIFDREKVFIDQKMIPLLQDFPELKVVFEHVTTADAVNFVQSTGSNVAATITAHHLLMNRNDMLAGGIRPHYYCLPILKRNDHQQALIAAATSGSEKFFLGTDSAPHAQSKKETACGCAGMYTAHAAIELYAEAFEQANALFQLEKFSSFNGPDFYGLERNPDTIRLLRQDWQVPDYYPFGSERLIPLRAGETIHWKLDDSNK